MADAAFAKVAGAAFARLHGDGAVGAGFRCFAGGIQRGGDRQVLLAGLAQGVHHRQPDVAHGFIPRLRFAAVDDAVRAFAAAVGAIVRTWPTVRWHSETGIVEVTEPEGEAIALHG